MTWFFFFFGYKLLTPVKLKCVCSILFDFLFLKICAAWMMSQFNHFQPDGFNGCSLSRSRPELMPCRMSSTIRDNYEIQSAGQSGLFLTKRRRDSVKIKQIKWCNQDISPLHVLPLVLQKLTGASNYTQCFFPSNSLFNLHLVHIFSCHYMCVKRTHKGQVFKIHV